VVEGEEVSDKVETEPVTLKARLKPLDWQVDCPASAYVKADQTLENYP
jgi:hypothetical protein